jgi:hypothetical protein
MGSGVTCRHSSRAAQWISDQHCRSQLSIHCRHDARQITAFTVPLPHLQSPYEIPVHDLGIGYRHRTLEYHLGPATYVLLQTNKSCMGPGPTTRPQDCLLPRIIHCHKRLRFLQHHHRVRSDLDANAAALPYQQGRMEKIGTACIFATGLV